MGKLTISLKGNDSATLRFTPSFEAVMTGLRMAGVEARHKDSSSRHPHTHGAGKEVPCAISGDSGTLLGFTITQTEETDIIMGKLSGYEEYAARYNRHLQSGDLGSCTEDLFLMADVLREEGLRIDELKALMLSFFFDLNGVGSVPAINRNTAKRAAMAVAASYISVHEMEEMYMDVIRYNTVPRAVMSVRDSLYLFGLCLENRCDEAEEILCRFVGGASK